MEGERLYLTKKPNFTLGEKKFNNQIEVYAWLNTEIAELTLIIWSVTNNYKTTLVWNIVANVAIHRQGVSKKIKVINYSVSLKLGLFEFALLCPTPTKINTVR